MHRQKKKRGEKIGWTGKLGLLVFLAFLVLAAIPAMDFVAAGMSGRHPTDYRLWEVIYLCCFFIVVFM